MGTKVSGNILIILASGMLKLAVKYRQSVSKAIRNENLFFRFMVPCFVTDRLIRSASVLTSTLKLVIGYFLQKP